MIGAPSSMAMRSADFAPVRCSMSRCALVWLAWLARVVVLPAQLTVLQHLVASVLLTLPTLIMFNAGYRPVRDFNVKAPVNLNALEGIGMHTIDDDMQMQVIRVLVQGIDGLVRLHAKFLNEDAYCFLDLRRAGLLAFTPTYDVVIDRVPAPHRF